MAGRTRSSSWKTFETLCSEDLRDALAFEANPKSFQDGGNTYSLLGIRLTANPDDDFPTFYQFIVGHLEHINTTWGIKGAHKSGTCEWPKLNPKRFAMMFYVNVSDISNVQAYIDGI